MEASVFEILISLYAFSWAGYFKDVPERLSLVHRSQYFYAYILYPHHLLISFCEAERYNARMYTYLSTHQHLLKDVVK